MAVNPKSLKNLKSPVKGEVRNPKGRGKGVPNSKTRMLRLLEIVQEIENPITGKTEEFTVMEQIDAKLILKAKSGNAAAINMLLDRLEGRPAQSVDVTTGGEKINKIKQILEASGLAKEVTGDRQIGGSTDGTPESSA